MGFVYRLERVLKIAESEKKSLESEYHELFERFDLAARRLMQLLEQKKESETAMQKQMMQPVSIDLLRLKTAEADRLDHQISDQSLQYRRLKDRLERLKATLQAKSIEVKKYEKMRDRKKQAYRLEEKKTDRKQMDEAASVQVIGHG